MMVRAPVAYSTYEEERREKGVVSFPDRKTHVAWARRLSRKVEIYLFFLLFYFYFFLEREIQWASKRKTLLFYIYFMFLCF